MFTAAKLIGAILMGGLGIVISELVKPLLPEGTDPGHLTLVNLCIGLVFGWKILGKRAGRGIWEAVNNGLTTVIVMVIVGLFTQGANEMLRRSLLSAYDSPIFAVKESFRFSIGYGAYLLDPTIIAALFGGVVVGGIVTEIASRHWR